MFVLAGAARAQDLTPDETSSLVDAGQAQAEDAASELPESAAPAEIPPPVETQVNAQVDVAPPVVEVAPPPAPPPPPVVEVVVQGRSRAAVLRRSAYAVAVVELEQAKKRSADLAELLARETAVTVQRAGGLGSRGAFALGGLGGDRLRFFLDGVPLELMGYVAGVQNVPLNLLERIEVYQGVVPAKLGADALGGAIQLVSEENVRRTGAAASYQMGSFGTHRLTAAGRYHHAPSGLTARGSVFFDKADNNYPVDVTAFDDSGRTRAVTLPRFHDGYKASGVNGAVGVVGKPWAERLMVSAFRSGFDNELQNGVSMGRPFGEVTFERQTFGVNARYVIARPQRGARFEATAGFARLDTQFRDLSNCSYDWYGRCSPRTPDTLRGEISGMAESIDQRTDTLFLRAEHTSACPIFSACASRSRPPTRTVQAKTSSAAPATTRSRSRAVCSPAC